MLSLKPALTAYAGILLVCICGCVAAQQPSLVTRTTVKTDKFDFGAGGTVSIVGAPMGSIVVTGTSKNEIEISAVIEIQAASEADLAILSAVTTYLTQESLGRVGILTSGTHNKLGDKKLWKKFPKNLIGLPFKIDYTVSVPRYCDLQIDAGKGDLVIKGVEGAIRVNALDSAAKIDLIGGGFVATFGAGDIEITMPDRSWRGGTIDAQLVSGTLSVHLPANLSAELDATILKSGQIENSFATFKPRVRTVPFTDRQIAAKAGNGGVSMKFSVGDGKLKLLPLDKPK